MDVKQLVDLGTDTLVVFKDHLIPLAALLVLAFLAGIWWRRSVDDGEIRGLRSQKQAAEDRVQLAHEKLEGVTAQIGTLQTRVVETEVVPLGGTEWRLS